MLRELRIRNLALIDDLALVLDAGLTVFTGETGAGKSILVGAIGLLLGERASSEAIRSGAEEAEMSGVFEFASLPPSLARLCAESGIAPDDNTLIIRRTIARNGKNRLRINQVPVPLASLKALGDLLVDLHGQHEHQSLLRPEAPRMVIDSLSPAAEARSAYDETYGEFTAARSALEDHDRKAADLASRRDVLEFEYTELAKLGLKAGEEHAIEEKLGTISSLSERTECMAAIVKLLEGGGGGDSLGRRIRAVRKNLETLAKYDPSVQGWLSDIDGAASILSELDTFAVCYLENAESAADAPSIDALNARLAKIQRLKKKYQCSSGGLLEKQANLKADLDTLENVDADRSLITKRLGAAEQACARAAKRLTQARKKACEEFDASLSAAMARLGFSGGEWKTVFMPEKALAPHGLEELRFEVRTNPGEPLLPLAKTASGGEISRLMLAIKTYMAEKDHVPVLIFDEIDAGIGGMLAGEVAKALKTLSETHQVVCISHLHHIASLADSHYRVYKVVEADRTVTRAKRLSGEEKIDEISRMLGDTTDISKKHARQLLGKKTAS